MVNGMKNVSNNKISIIVPIYNVEKYLKKCIDSLINQTYKNLEIILVDDGSPDKCGEICDQYKTIDSRIVVIHKKNGGLSDARNCGVKASTGDYITFVDSDDYISNDYVEYLFNLLISKNADMSIIMPHKFKENDKDFFKEVNERVILYSPNEALKVMLYQKKFSNSAYGKLYKKELIKDIKFPVGKLYEDVGTTYKYILKCKNKIVYSNQHKYFYLIRNNSIMRSAYKKNDKDYFYQAEILLNDMKKNGDKELINAAICRYVNANFSILLKIKKNKLYKDDRNEILHNIKKYSKKVFLNINSRFKTKIAILMVYFKLM